MLLFWKMHKIYPAQSFDDVTSGWRGSSSESLIFQARLNGRNEQLASLFDGGVCRAVS
jgi:hypothetical protein